MAAFSSGTVKVKAAHSVLWYVPFIADVNDKIAKNRIFDHWVCEWNGNVENAQRDQFYSFEVSWWKCRKAVPFVVWRWKEKI